jgi:uncharacterized delta-60 repeat protein
MHTEPLEPRRHLSVSLDPSFGDAGLLRFPDPREWVVSDRSLEYDPALDRFQRLRENGGQFIYIARLLEDGQPDPAFGKQGTVREDTGVGLGGHIADVASRPEGHSLVLTDFATGYVSTEPHILLRRPDGSLETAFADDGVLTLSNYDFNPNGNLEVQKLLWLPDGRFVVGAGPHYLASKLAFRRYHADGSEDRAFGANGLRSIVLPSDPRDTYDSLIHAILPQPDGKLVVVSTDENRHGGIRLRAFRLTTDGDLDAAYGSRGFRNVAAGRDVKFTHAALDGHRLLVSFSKRARPHLFRFRPDGRFDLAFNADGRFRPTQRNIGDELPFAVTPDHRVVFALRRIGPDEHRPGDTQDDTLLARLTPAGQLDPDFAPAGHYLRSGLPADEHPEQVAFDPRGRIIVTGRTDGSRFTGPPGLGGHYAARFILD